MRVVPFVGAIVTAASVTAAAQDLSGRKRRTIFDYIDVGMDHFSPITGEDVGDLINSFHKPSFETHRKMWADFKWLVGMEP